MELQSSWIGSSVIVLIGDLNCILYLIYFWFTSQEYMIGAESCADRQQSAILVHHQRHQLEIPATPLPSQGV